MDVYIDAEWYIHQKIFLIGYQHANYGVRQIWGNKLSRHYLNIVLSPALVTNDYIFFYGPDIAMIEKNFGMDIRNHYRCINLLRIFRNLLPGRSSYKLKSLEVDYNLPRIEDKYKSNIFSIYADWHTPRKRLKVIEYNKADVANMARLKEIIFKEHNVTDDYLNNYLLK
jgi:uncharacterized protein YprB with RNaseH-like and TPR domain